MNSPVGSAMIFAMSDLEHSSELIPAPVRSQANSPAPSTKFRSRHPLWLRMSHATNALSWLLMTISGVMIYWANDVYTPFIGRKFYQVFGLDHKLAIGLALHFTFMWLFIGTGLFYLIRLLTSGSWRELLPRRGDWLQIPVVALAELGLRPMPLSSGKFNPAQRCVYSAVLVVAALEVVCGFAIYKPFQMTELQSLLGGYETARLIHFVGMVFLLAFFFMHVAQVIRAGARDFYAMVIATPPHIERLGTSESGSVGLDVGLEAGLDATATLTKSPGASPGLATSAADARGSLRWQFRRVMITLSAWLVAVALIFAWTATRPESNGVVWPLRQALNMNAWIASHLFRSDAHEKLASSLEASIGGTQPRVNGAIGLEEDASDNDDTIEITEPGRPTQMLSIEDLLKMKQTATSAQFRCIEGWSRPISYKGVMFKDFMLATGFGVRTGGKFTNETPHQNLFSYVGFETANHRYYVSIDVISLLLPQSVLATQMNGEDLFEENGAPLRLVIPAKYGIKNIKRIKRIFFSDTRPPDYWEERGYDWWAGL